MRTIKIVADTGTPVILEAENGLTLGGLIEILSSKGIDFDLQKNFLTELDTEAIYAISEAKIPDGDVRLFSTVKDPKGNSERADAYTTIKAFITRDGEKAKNHFNKDKNYTNKGTDELQKLIQKYESKAGKAPATTTVNATPKVNTKSNEPKKKATVSVDDDPDFAKLKAKQKSFNPKLLRTSR